MLRKRGYSREFPTWRRGKNVTLNIDYVPRDLKKAAKVKAQEAGVSLRVLLLRWLANWVAGKRPDQGTPITAHPMQPVRWDSSGEVIRFKENAIVRYLLDWATPRGMSLNELSMMRFSEEDWTQFAQLIGYSVSGAGDLSYFNRAVLEEADRLADQLVAAREAATPARKAARTR